MNETGVHSKRLEAADKLLILLGKLGINVKNKWAASFVFRMMKIL